MCVKSAVCFTDIFIFLGILSFLKVNFEIFLYQMDIYCLDEFLRERDFFLFGKRVTVA